MEKCYTVKRTESMYNVFYIFVRRIGTITYTDEQPTMNVFIKCHVTWNLDSERVKKIRTIIVLVFILKRFWPEYEDSGRDENSI